jgi:hypothetical protein
MVSTSSDLGLIGSECFSRVTNSPTASALGDMRGIRSSVRPAIVAEVDKQSCHERQMAAVS